MKRSPWPLVAGMAYVIGIRRLGGLRSDHLVLGGLSLLDYYNEKSRAFLREFSPFILTGVIYDSMRYFYSSAVAGRVHVKGPYDRDKKWFGVVDPADSALLAPHEYFLRYPKVGLDLLCGFAYLTFVGEYLALAFLLFLKGERKYLKIYGLSFLAVNVLGWITYFVYPAAPPWYVTKYGFAPAPTDIEPEPAATARFDEILGTDFFSGIYSRNVAVYGAYPSLHVAYPLLVVWICILHGGLKWLGLPALAFYGVMCFSAVYLQHHYVVDVLLGSAYALLVAGAATFFLLRGSRGPLLRQTKPTPLQLSQQLR